MKLRKAIAPFLLVALVAGCTSPRFVSRSSAFQTGFDVLSLTAVMGIYR